MFQKAGGYCRSNFDQKKQNQDFLMKAINCYWQLLSLSLLPKRVPEGKELHLSNFDQKRQNQPFSVEVT
ncbi:hypothetical protein AYR62_13950 [Secundilactobacillus paracollinoides]|uniref:Uncharacterized protein n=1 Tax=Secundilactobacillus paracollinoides TaxID=240427 RepID=A0A1B2IWY7_9LACO|nr:hypothetical protein AYR61_04640 [Secundilactobacillus paracollinoides]ANZ65070.1 hypothetical protein AYR62_13950 [Secundilactobacillus paracollinoides]ANZ66539.1 hypothetical protein AYR63_04925 [Secundilactobacillus paracollinoides]